MGNSYTDLYIDEPLFDDDYDEYNISDFVGEWQDTKYGSQMLFELSNDKQILTGRSSTGAKAKGYIRGQSIQLELFYGTSNKKCEYKGSLEITNKLNYMIIWQKKNHSGQWRTTSSWIKL
ncbi:unnamed protein product [Didymodactylos carnosus]|uniref:Uncharacterized protein n=1 Tax=Didymodactylos carnosus TaxID=1234261 RepID=A0A814W7D1_9BILA|nr:unnamed protein product [Didymodactylos carnosus]CAF1194894.1 unnamed protein product [Didymodactylos carnosus]CAF3873190.1 unnamed protein product [Didymodactylos carnosus]CAF3959324.1 unnamed protein product [Didymodactylos carnosus]